MAVVGLLLLAASALSVYAQNPTVTVDSGPLVGLATTVPSLGGLAPGPINNFLGVPFAQGPPKRFKLPERPQPWTTPRLAQEVGPACLQQINYPDAQRAFSKMLYVNPPPKSESEDCLYLNVFTPASPAPAGGRAVMFWIQGGTFRIGQGGSPVFDGSYLAAYEDVIVVTFNYRTNVFGFPASPEIPLKERNIGLYDQRFALDWVQRNIAAFGGDPKKVTLFGNSGGGLSIDWLLTTFAKGTAPFRAAILQSGQTSYPPNGRDRQNSLGDWDKLVEAMGCADAASQLACIEAVPADKLLDFGAREPVAFRPYIDGVTCPAQPAQRRKQRRDAQVPLLIGTTKDDGSIYANKLNNVTEFFDSTFLALLTTLFPNGGTRDQLDQVLTDFGFHCNLARLGNDAVALDTPVWRYYYNAFFPNLAYPGFNLGVFHGSELYSMWSSYVIRPALSGGIASTPAQISLSNYMRAAWAKFAKDPTGGPGWARLGSQPQDVQMLGNGGQDVRQLVNPAFAGPGDGRCLTYNILYDTLNAGYGQDP